MNSPTSSSSPDSPDSAFEVRHNPNDAFELFAAQMQPLADDSERFFATIERDPELRKDFARVFELAWDSTSEVPCTFSQTDRDRFLTELFIQRGDAAASVARFQNVTHNLQQNLAWPQLKAFASRVLSLLEKPILSNDETLTDLALFASKVHALAYQREQGPLIENAWCIEQGEFGISNDEPIGTHSVQNCLSIALWEKESNTLLLTHVDDAVKSNFIDELLAHVPSGNIQARILGVRHSQETSGKKLEYTLTELNRLCISLVSADTSKLDIATSWVVNPHDFSVQEGVPGIQGPHALSVPIICWLSLTEKPLRKAFDLTHDKQFLPQRINTSQQLAFVEAYLPTSKTDLFQKLTNKEQPWEDAVYSEDLIHLLHDAMVPFREKLSALWDTLSIQGFIISEETQAVMRTMALYAPKYIGAEAQKPNEEQAQTFISNSYTFRGLQVVPNQAYFQALLDEV